MLSKNLIRHMVVVSGVAASGVMAMSPAPANDWCKAAIEYSNADNGVSVLVLRGGRPVCASSDVTTPHQLYSGTKSTVGLMAAAAVQDKLLTLDERASDTLPEWRTDPEKSKITLRELLSMTSGHAQKVGRPIGYAEAVGAPLSFSPGTRFQYGPGPLQIFGEIMRRKLIAAGRNGNPRVYLERRILFPLGVRVGAWRDGPDGNPLMPDGLSLAAAEWAKIGEFVRLGGRHGARQLVDRKAFSELFKGSAANPAYGLTWWLPHPSSANGPTADGTDISSRAAELPSDMVVAGGAGKQRLYVIPSLKLTIVRQATFDDVAARTGRAPTTSAWSDTHFVHLILDKNRAHRLRTEIIQPDRHPATKGAANDLEPQ